MSKHRAAAHRAPSARRTAKIVGGLAAGVTLAVVTTGVALAGTTGSADPMDFVASAFSPQGSDLSRDSDRSADSDAASKAALLDAAGSTGVVLTAREQIVAEDAKTFAASKLADYGWDGSQFQCLDSLWTKESHWRVNAYNPSGAYGIPQSMPGSKMASVADDWQTNPETQVIWGLRYIAGRWGTPCDAWANSQAKNWY